MAWYKTGTVSVTNGSTSVTGSGTSWVSGVGVGETFYGPDGKLYEIAAIVSATNITLASTYLGATQSGQTYQIVPTQSYIRDLAAQAAQLVADYAAVASNAGAGKFGDGTLANPGVRFTADENTGMRRVGTDALALVVGGEDKLTLTSTGVNNTAIGGTTPSTGAFTTLSASGVLSFSGQDSYFGSATRRTYWRSDSNGVSLLTGPTQTGAGVYFDTANDKVQLFAGSANRAEVTTTGLSVTGALSATYAGTSGLANAGNSALSIQSAANAVISFNVPDASSAGLYFGYSGNAYWAGIERNGASGLRLVCAGNSLNYDPSGNLGLGVTPSAWGGLKALEIAGVGSSLASASNNNLYLSANAWYNGTNWRYGITAAASQYQSFSGQHVWYTAPSGTAGTAISFTQAMTLDASGNLGIGTSSPGVKLHLSGTSPFAKAQDTAALQTGFQATNTTGNFYLAIESSTPASAFNSGSANARLLYSDGAYPLIFFTNAAERMRLDSSGNLGLGVTPSAWASFYKGFDVSTYSAVYGASTNNAGLINNGYFNGTNWIYKNTAAASNYSQSGGVHSWFTAPSGTAGNAITFTQAMTLDASGELRLRTDGGTARYFAGPTGAEAYFGYNSDGTAQINGRSGYAMLFSIGGSECARIDSSGNLGLGVTPSAWQAGWKVFEVGNSGNAVVNDAATSLRLTSNARYNGSTWTYASTNVAATYAINGGAHIWSTAPSGTAGNAITFTQAMTLDASGNLGIGTAGSSIAARLDVQNGSTASAITSYFTKGASDPNFRLGFENGSGTTVDSPQAALRFDYAGSDSLAKMVFWRGGSANCSAIAFNIGGAGASTERMRIDSAGNLTLGHTVPGAFIDVNSVWLDGQSGQGGASHATGKPSGTQYWYFSYGGTAIGSITQSGTTAVAYNTTSDHRLKTNVRPADAARFMDIEFVDFEWTDGRHDCGVIAHQLASVYPDLVLGEKDATEVRTVEITPAVPAVTEQVLVTPAVEAVPEVLDDDGNVLQAAVESVEAVYETVEVTPAVPAVTEEQTFPVYQQVNYIGLIGRMGTRVQQLQRTVDAQAAMLATQTAMLAAMEARLAALEAA